jgi:hypothetical protein
MPVDEDLCDHCGYHRILKKVIDMDGVQRADRSTGLERTVRRHLDDPESTASTLVWVKIVAGFFAAALLFVCLGSFWWIGALLIGGGLAWYYVRARTSASGDDSDFNRDPLVSLVWLGMLAVQRGVGWRQLTWPFPRCSVLVLRDPTFGDDDLAELENLDSFQAMDFEGTQVSDAGLVYLAQSRRLQFLVLRNTRVTGAGLRGLQESLANTWIWV